MPLRAETPATGVLRRLRVNGGMALLIGGVAVPAVLGGLVAVATRGGGDGERPAPQVTRSYAAPTTAVPRPQVYPTYGEYVPPQAVAKVTTSAPAPRRTTATPTPARTCPPEWVRNPWLRRWCRMHGFDTNVP